MLCVACGGGSKESAEPAVAPAENTSAVVPADSAPDAPNQDAPEQSDAVDFTLTDVHGTSHSLSQYRGKRVVLEWFNPECPFVKHAYAKGPLNKLAADELAKGDVVWLAINSGAPGKQGAGVDLNKKAHADWAMKQPVLVDENGAVGKQFGAKSTPHMFVLNAEGAIVYKGALDNAPLGKVEGGGAYANYVAAALGSLRAGTPVAVAETPSYGCSVKY